MARRKRAETPVPSRIADAPIPDQRSFFDELKRLLPRGEEPIATRSDPLMHRLHVACASGKTYSVSYVNLVRAPATPVEVRREQDVKSVADLSDAELKRLIEQMASAVREQTEADAKAAENARDDECRCVPHGKEGDPDAPPCKQHPNGDGKRPRPHPTEGPWPWTPEQDEIAEGRLLEAWAAHHLNLPATHECELCGLHPRDGVVPAEVLAMNNMGQLYSVHRKCLVERNPGDMRLDCDPDVIETHCPYGDDDNDDDNDEDEDDD